ncbi:MAG: hypothetical protein LBK64_06040 [Spirochaetaceae bacterium]|jgi:uncharacterized integral membrane protein|nr:hypothetical protein [Spirochaetaceae bacterium]
MWRLLRTVILFAILLLFIGLNLGHYCDVSYWFTKEPLNLPVYVIVFSSFTLGLLCSIPLAFSFGRKRKAKANAGAGASEQGPSVPDSKKKKDNKKGGGTKKDGEIRDINDGSYGID